MINLDIEGLHLKESHGKQAHYTCDSKDFRRIILFVGSDFSYVWLMNVIQIPVEQKKWEIKYQFYDFEEDITFSISYLLTEGQTFFSIKKLWRNAESFERRITLETGLQIFEEYKFAKYAQKPFIKKEHQILHQDNIGRNSSFLNLYWSGGEIVDGEFESDEYRIGLEVILAQSEAPQMFQIVESYFPLRGLFYSYLLASCIENQYNFIIPDRAKGIRMVVMELHRILDDLFYLDQISSELGNQVFREFLKGWKMKVQSLLISYSGNEFGRHSIIAGGVRLDVSQSWSSRTIQELTQLESSIDGLRKNLLYLSDNEELLQSQIVTKENVFEWSLTGPLARAAGVNLDLRQKDPIYFYGDIDFSVPVGVHGTLFDLISVLLEESLQSAQIIIQVLDNLPTGQFQLEEDGFFVPKFMDEGDDQYFKSNIKNYLKSVEVNQSGFVEGPRGIMGVNILKSAHKSQVDLLAANSYLPDLMSKKIPGMEIEDIKLLWNAFDPDFKEIEK